MSIDVTTTARGVAPSANTNNNVSASTTSTADKSSTDTSFKDEMTKVEAKEDKKEVVEQAPKQEKSLKTVKKSEEKKIDTHKKVDAISQNIISENQVLNASISLNSEEMFTNANSLLQNDIAQMIENTTQINNVRNNVWNFSLGEDLQSNLVITQSDAQFFLNLTNSNDVSSRNMFSQAINMLNSGVNSKQVAQNFKVSQALLNALSEARQNNQPLRIDFDQNISVILQVSKGGELAARFIPGDKAVEQYLKNNIESLKASFDEQDLPYSELSYSNSSKEQNKRRRNEQKQGE